MIILIMHRYIIIGLQIQKRWNIPVIEKLLKKVNWTFSGRQFRFLVHNRF